MDGAVVSTTTVNAAEAGLALPATSTATAVRAWVPSFSAAVGVKLQPPSVVTVVLPISVPLSYRLMVAPGSPLPFSCGRVSSVLCPRVRLPVTLPTSSLTVAIIGAAGASVSTVRSKLAAGLTLPAVSVAVTVRVCAPFASGAVGVKLQVPLLPAWTVPISVPLSRMRTVLFASAVPLSAGRASSVRCPLVNGPVMLPISSITALITGVAGALVSTVSVNGVERALVLPTPSVALTRRLCEPATSAVSGVKVQLPVSPTCALPIAVPLSKIVTVEPISPMPESVGRVSLVLCPLAICPVTGAVSSVTSVIAGICGITVSTTRLKAADGWLMLPSPSVAVTVNTCPPVLSAASGVKLQTPLASAVTEPISVSPSKMRTVELASAVPFSVGRGSLVLWPSVNAPVNSGTSSTTLVIVGGCGAVMSGAVTVAAGPVFAAASVAVALNGSPLVCGVVRVTVKRPSSSAVALPSGALSGPVTVTVLPASAVPDRVVPSSETSRSDGAAGGVRSGVATVAAGPVLSAVSVAVALNSSPVICGVVSSMLKLPLSSTTPLPTFSLLALTMVTVLPGSARPVTTAPSGVIASSSGASGAVVSTAPVLVGWLLLPAASVAMAVSCWPLVCGALSVTLKFPSSPAMALPSSVPAALVMAILLPASALPVTVRPSLLTARSSGASGATVSTTMANGAESPLVPAGVVAVAVN